MTEPVKFPVGTRVELVENHEENWPQEFGVVLYVEDLPWGVCYTVLVDDKYRDEFEEGKEWTRDDGLREVTEDQMRLACPKG